MKKFFAVLAGALALALAVPAEASWNVRQKGSGATVWTDGSVEVPTGDSGLVAYITEAGTASTWFVISHKKGTLVRVYAVPNSSTPIAGARNNLRFRIGNGDSFTHVSALSLDISNTRGYGTSAVTTLTGVGLTKTTVNQGEVIAINSDGAGPSQDATVILVIE